MFQKDTEQPLSLGCCSPSYTYLFSLCHFSESREYSDGILEKWPGHFPIIQAGVESWSRQSPQWEAAVPERDPPFSPAETDAAPGLWLWLPRTHGAGVDTGLGFQPFVPVSHPPGKEGMGTQGTSLQGWLCYRIIDQYGMEGTFMVDTIGLHCHIHVHLTGRNVIWSLFRNGLYDGLQYRVLNIL